MCLLSNQTPLVYSTGSVSDACATACSEYMLLDTSLLVFFLNSKHTPLALTRTTGIVNRSSQAMPSLSHAYPTKQVLDLDR